MIVALLAMALATGAAPAPPAPRPPDSRIQTVGYDPQQIVTLRVAAGYSLAVQFSPGERIEVVSIGNSGGWQAIPDHRGDFLFVKPATMAAETNMTVVTDARRYLFLLVPVAFPASDLPFSLQFTYPSSAPASIQPEPPATRYVMRGPKELRPIAMSDDGMFTRIIWPEKVALPAVYMIDVHGKEALANGVIRDGAYTIEGVAREFVFRLGNAKLVATRRILKRPKVK